jgi:hypothetical protein
MQRGDPGDLMGSLAVAEEPRFNLVLWLMHGLRTTGVEVI